MMIPTPIGTLLGNRYLLLAEEMLQFTAQTMPAIHTNMAAQALSALDVEFPNIAAVLDTLSIHPDSPLYQLVMDLYLAVGEYLDIRYLWEDNRRWGWALVEQAISPELPDELLAFFSASDQSTTRNNIEPEELKSLAEGYNKLGLALWHKGQPNESIHFLQKSLEFQRQVGSVLGMVGLLLNISNVYYATGAYADGLQHVQEALQIAQIAEHRPLEAHVLPHLANSYLSNGLITEAGQAYEHAIVLFEELGDEPEVAEVKFNYALYCDLCGKHQQALQLARESAMLMEKYGFPGANVIRGWIEQQEQTQSSSAVSD